MQIIKDKNNVVLFAGEKFELTDKMLIAEGWTAPVVNSKTHTIEQVDSVPVDYRGGWYTYDGQWTKTANWKEPEVPKPDPVTEAKKELEQVKLDQADKALSLAYLDKRMAAIEKILGLGA